MKKASGQSVVGSGQSAIGNRQSAVGSFRNGILILVVCCMMLFLAGCCGFTRGGKLPELADLTEGISDLTPEEVSEMVDTHADQFQTLRGWGKIQIQTWEERYKFSQVFVLEKPERFRLETLGAFDQPAIFLTSDEELLSLYSKKHKTFYIGIPSQENLFKLSGINLSVEDTIQVLSGNPPRLSRVDSEWGFPVEPVKYYLERTSLQDNKVQRIWFDTKIPAIYKIQEHMLTNGKLLLEIDFQDYRSEEGTYPIPADILIDRPLDKTRIYIEYKSFGVNQQIDQTIFRFVPKEKDIKTHNLDDATVDQLERLAPYEEFRAKKEE